MHPVHPLTLWRPTRATLLVAGMLVAATLPASAQVFQGVVRDSATRRPLPAAAVTLRGPGDSLAASAVTDENGRYFMRAGAAGTYLVAARRIGYNPANTVTRTVKASESVVMDVIMGRLPAQLDTVRSTSNERFTLSWASRGNALFDRHMKETDGFFFSGAEIEWSKIPIGEFLAKLPGFRIVTAGVRQVAGIPINEHQRLTTTSPYNCIKLRMDWSADVVALRDTVIIVQRGPNASFAIPMAGIVGIEVYSDAMEAPKDWRMDIPRRCAFIQFWSKDGW